MTPPIFSWAGWGYGPVAGLLGAGYLGCAVCFLRRRNELTARRLPRASLIYLSAVFAALLF